MFEWTKEYQAIFFMLMEALYKQPTLKYPDPEKLYILFTGASKYGWAGVLTQPYTEGDDMSTQSCAIKAQKSNASHSNKVDKTPQTWPIIQLPM